MILKPGVSFEVFEPMWGLNYRLTCDEIFDGEFDFPTHHGHWIDYCSRDYYRGVSLKLIAELISPAKQLYEAAPSIWPNKYTSVEEVYFPKTQDSQNLYDIYKGYFYDRGALPLRDTTLDEMEKLSFEAPYQRTLSERILVKVDREHIHELVIILDDIRDKIVQYLRSLYPESKYPRFKPEMWDRFF